MAHGPERRVGSCCGHSREDRRWRDFAPHQVRLRETVQQENRRPGPARAHEDCGVARLDLGGREIIHGHLSPRGVEPIPHRDSSI